MTSSDSGPKDIVSLDEFGSHVRLVTINRPDARNAIDSRVTQRLDAIVAATEADAEVWVVVLTGAGGAAFSAGADLKSVARSGFASLYTRSGGFAGFTAAERRKPWIAAVEGFALAGGCEIALACDLIVAAKNMRSLVFRKCLGV